MTDKDMALESIKAFWGGLAKESASKFYSSLGMLFPFAGLKKEAVQAYIEKIKNDSSLSADEQYLQIAGAKKHLKQLENQLSIINIAQNAAEPDTDFSITSKVDDEWLSRFLDASRFVTNEEAQLLWGHILAGEFQSPGSTPPSVTRILSELTTEYAEKFSSLCSTIFTLIPANSDNIVQTSTAFELLVLDCDTSTSDYLFGLGLDYSSLKELELLGLITYSESGSVRLFPKAQIPRFHVYYHGYAFTIKEYPHNNIPIGNVRLTQAGRCISRYVKRKYITDHIPAIIDYFRKQTLEISIDPQIVIHEEIKDGSVYFHINL